MIVRCDCMTLYPAVCLGARACAWTPHLPIERRYVFYRERVWQAVALLATAPCSAAFCIAAAAAFPTGGIIAETAGEPRNAGRRRDRMRSAHTRNEERRRTAYDWCTGCAGAAPRALPAASDGGASGKKAPNMQSGLDEFSHAWCVARLFRAAPGAAIDAPAHLPAHLPEGTCAEGRR